MRGLNSWVDGAAPESSGAVKERLGQWLQEGHWEGVVQLVDQERSAVRRLTSWLMDPDPLRRWRAVSAFGHLAAVRPAAVARMVGRLAATLNDEATIHIGLAPAAIGEMTVVDPGLTREVVRIVVHYLEDEEACRGENRNAPLLCAVLWGVGRIATVNWPEVGEVWSHWIGYTRDRDVGVRVHAWWALAHSRKRWQADGKVVGKADWQTALEDLGRAQVYDPLTRVFVERSVADWAGEAMGAGGERILVRQGEVGLRTCE